MPASSNARRAKLGYSTRMSIRGKPILLDGPVGTRLNALGVETPAPGWTAHVLESHRDVIARIHDDYELAGAQLHTAVTFRTQRRVYPKTWEKLARLAVSLARGAASRHVAGSIAPLEDCYRPDLSPGAAAEDEHRELAEVLADARVALLLCEAFPNVEEGLAAARAALTTKLPVWLSFTAGPGANLLSPLEFELAAQRAIDLGVEVVLINCVPVRDTARFLQPLAKRGIPFGAYANAGAPTSSLGWNVDAQQADVDAYVRAASEWIAMGASVVGSCCGTGPAHIAALKSLGEQ